MEDEYKKLFLYQKRWAKHWTTYSAHRAHSSTQWMWEPAQETFDFICTLQKDMKQSPYSDKVIELYNFFVKKTQEAESQKELWYTNGYDYYCDCIRYIQTQLKNISSGIPVKIYPIRN